MKPAFCKRTLRSSRLFVRMSVLLFLLLAFAAHASEKISIASQVLAENRVVDVELPAGYTTTSGEIYPVVYVLDGDNLFPPSAAIARWLAYVTRTPRMIVVGIRNTHRTRDFTTPWNAATKPANSLAWMVPNAGGADTFLSFVEKELQPEIERRYRTAPFRIAIGHSLGGLLVLRALTARPDLFQASISISPPAAWNDDEVIKALRFDSALVRTRALFIASAGNDPADTTPAFHRVVETLTENRGAVRWRSEIFPAEDHGTVALPAVQAGLEFIFARWRVPGYVSDAGLAAITEYYASLARTYGYAVRFQEDEMARLAAQWSRAGKTREAQALYEAIVRDHPDSANAHDDLGGALLKQGEIAAARKAFDRAVVLGERNHDPNLEIYKRHAAKTGE